MLSKCCSNIANKYDIKAGGDDILVPNLDNKSKFILHYEYLQLYLSLEMKLVRAHRILKFKQCGWLTKYIDFNIKKRKNGKEEKLA